jgi:hypothetical protein
LRNVRVNLFAEVKLSKSGPRSSVLRPRVVQWKFTDVSEECIASRFRLEYETKQTAVNRR